MNKFGFVIMLITLVILGGGAYFISSREPKPIAQVDSDTYQYFWGNGCPHCENVSKFTDTWSGKDKIKIKKLEVWNSPANARIMAEQAKVCGIKQSELAVPFLITPDKKCLMGDTPIIDLYKSLNL